MAKNHDLILCLFFFFIKSLKMPPGTGPFDGRSNQR